MALGFNRHFSAFMSPAPAPSQSLITSTIQERGSRGEGELGPPALLENGLVCTKKVPPRDQCHLSPSSAGDT